MGYLFDSIDDIVNLNSKKFLVAKIRFFRDKNVNTDILR